MDQTLSSEVIDAGSTAWMLTSSALVLLMVPGRALFYGGMVRRKNILTTMMHSFVAMAVIGVQWVVIGYALVFGESYGGLIGWDWRLIGLSGLSHDRAGRGGWRRQDLRGAVGGLHPHPHVRARQ